ncbi:WYL domain-containing protein [Corynebacterium hindlerae]|uniref:helix-turn-helix transcriptional regulator n=1 Tax=Corynebacterium hindlerae TaxID=699041 RepID=UPI001AD65413|nr:WYL domain-containing protein [Corynebacterium hindlerae]QTH58824.1 WYL domain-containing protein [Corynebacterium hindlerae]
MTDKDPGLERLTNLTFAFLNAKQLGKQFLTAAWVKKNVAGYPEKSFDKAFQRDRAVLMKVGVPIEAIAGVAIENGERVTGYRLQEDEYSLPEVQFTPEEATVLGLAGERGLTGELSVFARSGWTKIAASGATRTFTGPTTIGSVGDMQAFKAKTLDQIVSACTGNQRLSFSYRPHSHVDAQHRFMDPWGLVPLRGRMYLVGFAPDRGDVRSFRITRVSDIKVTGVAEHPKPADANLQDIVETALRRGKELVSATLRVKPGTAPELETQGVRDRDKLMVTDVDKQWLVGECLAGAPAVVLLEPAELRDDIRHRLQTVKEQH